MTCAKKLCKPVSALCELPVEQPFPLVGVNTFEEVPVGMIELYQGKVRSNTVEQSPVGVIELYQRKGRGNIVNNHQSGSSSWIANCPPVRTC